MLGFQKQERKSVFFERSKTFIPHWEVQEHSRRGPFDGRSDLYVTGKRKLGFQKQELKSAFVEWSKTFIV